MMLTKPIERLIHPIDVGTMHVMQQIMGLLPLFIQEKLVNSSAKKYPYMGFVVEPYSYFLFYEIDEMERAQSLIPEGFRLIKTRVFEDDEPKHYAIFSCFTAHTSAFWGARVEFYLIAEDEETGLLTWVIVDYDSNTISHDKKHGLRSPSANAVISTNYDGTLFVDVKRNDGTRALVFDSVVTHGEMKKLDQRLWLEGNLSVCYGKELSNGPAEVFGLQFDPNEVAQAWQIPNSDLHIHTNTWYQGLCKNEPGMQVCFPYAQHFVSDSPGHGSQIKNREELEQAVTALDFEQIEVFSTTQFKTMFIAGMVISMVITSILLVLVIF